MAAPKPDFSAYDLASEGVVVDFSPLHQRLQMLAQAQNVIPDPLGISGGLVNRPGLTKLNASALAGSVLGSVQAPFASLVDYATLYFAHQTAGSAENWGSTPDLGVTPSLSLATIGNWQDGTAYFANSFDVLRMAEFYNGQLFYASSDYTSGTTSPAIRVFNGTDDREISRINPATTKGIVGMFASGGYLHVLTLDSGTTDADWSCRVFRMDINGRLTQVGSALPTGYVPTALIVHNGFIFVGGSRLTTTNEAQVFRIQPLDETSWSVDATLNADDYTVTGFASFQGLLYATVKNGGAATKGKVLQRSLAGVWSTVDSTSNNTGSYESIKVFAGALYASSRNYSTAGNTAVIRKSSDGASWSTVYNSSSTDGVGTLTVIGLRLFSHYNTKLLHSTTGSSYTSATLLASGVLGTVLGALVRSGAAEWSAPTPTTASTTTTSASSLSTSQLSGYTQLWSRRLAQFWYRDSNGTIQTNASTATAGTVSSVVDADGVFQRMNNNGTARAGITLGNTSNGLFWWEHQPMAEFTFRTDASNTTSLRYYIGLFSGNVAVDSDDDMANRKMVCVRYSTTVSDTGWMVVTADGTTQTLGSQIMAYAVDTNYRVRIQWTSNSTATITMWNLDTGETATVSVSLSSFTGTGLNVVCTHALNANRNIDIRGIHAEYS